METISKFISNSKLSSLHLEPIHSSKDNRIRTIRLSEDYRIVLLHPDSGNTFIFLWVDHHDEAMEWAKNKRFELHPETGALQMISTELLEEHNQLVSSELEEQGLFTKVKDKYLLKCGVPPDYIQILKSLQNETDLDEILPELPPEVGDALLGFAAGLSVDEVITDYLNVTKKENITLAESLNLPETQSSFYVVSDDADLERVLEAPLAKWRIFLHPNQRAIVGMNAKGSVKVTGGAGTGKTVVAMHRTKHLAEQSLKEGLGRILLTTYSRNLASDIKNNLLTLCDFDTVSRIDVQNIDAWAKEFLNKHGYPVNIASKEITDAFWKETYKQCKSAESYSLNFLKEEWQQVIQQNDISTQAEYLKVSRIGRGSKLDRIDRMVLWPIFAAFRNRLDSGDLMEFNDVLREARKLLEKEPALSPFSSIVVDEGQDMSKNVFRLIRAMVPAGDNDIFIVGDPRQRIYQRPIVLSQLNIFALGRRSRKLYLNYRTTEEVRRYAVSILEGLTFDDLDGGEDDQLGYHSLSRGPTPIIKLLSNRENENDYIITHIKNLIDHAHVASSSICLVLRTNALVDSYAEMLSEASIGLYKLSAEDVDIQDKPGVRLSTMHRIKGLEFDHMIIASVNSDTIPMTRDNDDQTIKFRSENVEEIERSLLYVAATRARVSLLITSWGNPSRFIEGMVADA